MGFLDTFKGNQYKAELETLKQEHETLQSLMTPEMPTGQWTEMPRREEKW